MFEWIVLALILSVLLNIFLVWYARRVILELMDVSENMQILTEEVVSFDSHLNSVHELEVFYGDATLGNLIRHSKALVDTLEDFVELYGLFNEDIEDNLTEEVLDDADAETTEA